MTPVPFKIGTCSWKYDSWKGIIYSKHAQQNYLQEYARHFNTVEIDQWFWSLFAGNKVALPKENTVLEYVDAVPDDFTFSIKVPNAITLTHHYRKGKNQPLIENPYFLSPEVMHRFLEKLEPMKHLLGPLMFQFEYLNKQKMESRSRFLDLFGQFLEQCPAEYSYAVEIRNPNYLNNTYFELLQELGAAHVFLQGYYMPSIFDVYDKFKDHIHRLSVIRLLGPDRRGIEESSKEIWNRIIEDRDAELEQLYRMIRDLQQREVEIFINVNNHYEGSAPITIQRIVNKFKK